jgi:hypothetical protein
VRAFSSWDQLSTRTSWGAREPVAICRGLVKMKRPSCVTSYDWWQASRWNPEASNGGSDEAFVPPGGTYTDEVEEEGSELYQCCIHPWMRTVMTARE